MAKNQTNAKFHKFLQILIKFGSHIFFSCCQLLSNTQNIIFIEMQIIKLHKKKKNQ